MPNYLSVARVDEIVPGTAKQVAAGGKALAIYNVGGKFYCTQGVCLHRGGPLGEGDLDGTTVTCPWHGWEYDVTSGVNKMNPDVRLACHSIMVEGGEIKVSLD